MSNDNDFPPSCFLKSACDEKQYISLQWPKGKGCVPAKYYSCVGLHRKYRKELNQMLTFPSHQDTTPTIPQPSEIHTALIASSQKEAWGRG